MRVQTLMELVGTNKTGFVIQHIKDGFRKIQRDNRENLEESSLSIVSGVEDYNFPKNMEKILDVKIISDPTETGYVVDWNKYMWYDYGRTFKLQKIDTNGLYNTPDSSHANGIKIVYTVMGYVFVYNPDGDSGYYTTGCITTGAEVQIPVPTILLSSIVYIGTNIRADYGVQGHYYKRTAYNKITDEDNLTDGDIYMISSRSVIDFQATWGASSNTVGTVFKYVQGATAPVLSNLDSLEHLGSPIEEGTLTIGTTYQISAVSGAEDFTLDGASADTFGTVFTATDNTITLTAADSVIALPTWETIDFTDTDLWTDVTEQTSPDENSYINIDENYTDALVEFVKSKVTTDPKMEVFREKQFQKKTFEAQETRTTENKVSMPPRVYSLR